MNPAYENNYISVPWVRQPPCSANRLARFEKRWRQVALGHMQGQNDACTHPRRGDAVWDLADARGFVFISEEQLAANPHCKPVTTRKHVNCRITSVVGCISGLLSSSKAIASSDTPPVNPRVFTLMGRLGPSEPSPWPRHGDVS